MAGAGLAACTSAAPSEARTFVTATATGDESACRALHDPKLRDECRAFAISNSASLDIDAVLLACQDIETAVWREECVFLACDASEVSLDDARRVCVQAGRFQARCVGHAATRTILHRIADIPPGQEDRLVAQATAAAKQALGPESDGRAIELVVRILADRAGPNGLDELVCGNAPAEVCTAVYAELLTRWAADRDQDTAAFVRPACARTVTVERAQMAGLPPWSPAYDAPVQVALMRACRR